MNWYTIIVGIVFLITLMLFGMWTNIRAYRKGWKSCEKNARASLMREQWKSILYKV